MSLTHGVLARDLQNTSSKSVRVVLARHAGEFEADAVRQFLTVEVGSVGGLEIGEVEFLAGPPLGEVRLLARRG